MLGPLTGLLDIVRQSGPAGALVASAIVGLTLALILLAHFKGLWTSLQGAGQTVDFQAKLLAMIETLRASEEALRRQLDEMGRNNRVAQDEITDLRVQLALLRSQRRRLIDMLRRAEETGGRLLALPKPTGTAP